MTIAALLAGRARSWATRAVLWRCADVGEGCVVLGKIWVHGTGVVRLGRDVRLDGSGIPIELHADRGATLEIGDGAWLEPGVSIEAVGRVTLGPRCRLHRLAKVMDNSFHHVQGDRYVRPDTAPVVLEADVEVGESAIVLPGAHLEAGVVLRPHTVVGRRVRAGQVLEGNPPRVVRAQA